MPAQHEWVPHLEARRITLTPCCINLARRVVFMVTGADKAQSLRNVFEIERTPDLHPAHAIAPVDGELIWLVDSAAASLL